MFCQSEPGQLRHPPISTIKKKLKIPRQLRNVAAVIDLPDWEHLDFIWGTDARDRVYDKMVAMMVAMEMGRPLPNGTPLTGSWHDLLLIANLATVALAGAVIGWRTLAARQRWGYQELS